MAHAYHTSDMCVTTSNAGDAAIPRKVPKAGRHGPTLGVWRKMRDRCGNPKSSAWAHYGGRGISVCDRWSSYENFLADMGERPDGLSIDRIDNDGNYEPGNCRWATAKEQCRNRRGNVLFDYQGERLCIVEIAERAGANADLLASRLNAGWSVQRAIESPEWARAEIQAYDFMYVSARDFAARKAALLASGLTLDEIANRVPRRKSTAHAAPSPPHSLTAPPSGEVA